ncbi:MAG: histidine kinase N-terminal 7TM domain-containing protein [Anaerolineae bacterium]
MPAVRRIVRPMHRYGEADFDASYFEWGFHDRETQLREAESVLWIVASPAPLSILDIACGAGTHAVYWARQGHHVTGVDISETFIARAREAARDEGTEVVFAVQDVRALTCREEFDLVTWIEHSFMDAAVLAKIWSALRPGGAFVYDDRNPEHARTKARSGNWRDWHEREGVFYLERHETDPVSGRHEDVWLTVDPAAGPMRQVVTLPRGALRARAGQETMLRRPPCIRFRWLCGRVVLCPCGAGKPLGRAAGPDHTLAEPGEGTMEFTPYVLPHIAATLVVFVVALLAWTRRRVPGVTAFFILMVAIGLWAGGNALELASTTLPRMLFWANLEYFGIVSIPMLWFVFAMQYTGRSHMLTRRRLLLLALVPLISIVLVWTNPLHELMRYNVSVDSSGPFRFIAKSYGPWLYVELVYNYVLLLAATLVLMVALIRTHHVYRVQGALVFVGTVLPWAANLSYVIGHSPITNMDLTPPAFALSGLLMAFGVVRFQALDLVPAARDKVLESLTDGIAVLDSTGRIVDLNAAAAVMLGCPSEVALGPVGMKFDPALRQHFLSPRETRTEVVTGDGRRHIDLRVSALRSRRRVGGWVVVMQDITTRKLAEQEREKLILELQDALGRINTLRGLIPICANCKKIRDDSGYWRQVEEYMKAHSEAEFTHAICPECLSKLYPEYAGDLPA